MTVERKQKKREYSKEWYIKNRDEIIAKRKLYEDQQKESKDEEVIKKLEDRRNKKKERDKLKYEQNKEQRSIKHKKYRENNKEKIKNKNKEWRNNNKEKLKSDHKQWVEQNKDCMCEYNKEYRQKDSYKTYMKKYLKQYRKHYERNRLNNDPFFKCVKLLRSRTRSAVKHFNLRKSLTTIDMLGCDTITLLEWLQWSGEVYDPNFNIYNYDSSIYHIDHIKTFADVKAGIYTLEEVCHYTNLQILPADVNLSKGGTSW